jgi:hypothetical protein
MAPRSSTSSNPTIIGITGTTRGFGGRPSTKIVGIVQNPDGSAAVRAVVRLRGEYINSQQPVLTNAAGRFELQPEFIPLDEKTQKRAFVQSLVAFDPFRPLAARVNSVRNADSGQSGSWGSSATLPVLLQESTPPRALLRCSWLGSVASFVPGVLRREWSRDERPGIIT